MPDVQATLTFPNLSSLTAIRPEARPIIYVTVVGCTFAAYAHEITACVCLAALGIVALTAVAIVEIRWAGHDANCGKPASRKS
jgi:hypothetical protein